MCVNLAATVATPGRVLGFGLVRKKIGAATGDQAPGFDRVRADLTHFGDVAQEATVLCHM